MSRLNKLSALAAAVALSGGLAACGGGGGSTDTSMMQTPQEMCEADGGRYNADGSCSSAEEVQIEMLQGQINALRTQLGLEPSDDLGASITELQTELAGLRKQIQDMEDAEDAAERAAMNAMARKLYNGLDGIDSTVASVTVTGSSVTGTFDTDGDGTDAAEAELVVEASGTATPSAGGWGGTDYVHTNEAGTVINHVVAYSNPSPNNVQPFAEKHAGIITDATGEIPAGSFGTFAITGADFASGAGTKTHAIPTNADGTPQDYVSVRGTFDGAPGVFRCSDSCVSAVDESTGVKFTGTWWFVGDDNAMTSTPDPNYLTFGWWARDAGSSVRVASFVDTVGTVAESGDIAIVEGTATYSGGAAGKAAIYDPIADANNAAGAFTADAMFMVDFGDESAQGTISGTVDNFSVAGEDKDWSVAFEESDISATASFGIATEGTVWTIGGVDAAASGDWSGQMYDNASSGVPQGLSGQFQSTYRNIGEMVGAFGADLDE